MRHPRGRDIEHPDAWDADAYDRLSDPQFEWGQRVLGRLELRGDETVMDAGCGTGRLTALLLERLLHGRVIAVDRSGAMLARARANLAAFEGRVTFLCADLETLSLARSLDAIFSTATFHWVLDHESLFRSMESVLTPGGRLEAQCGGGPNLRKLRERVEVLIRAEPYADHFVGWKEPWIFPWPGEAAGQLERAGFVDVITDLEPAPIRLGGNGEFRSFLTRVVLWPHLGRLPGELRPSFIDSLVAKAADDESPFELDYWRLDLSAKRPMR